MSRRIITVVLWAIVGGLLLAACCGNWREVWGACRQDSMSPKFADLRTITGAVASSAQGFDPVLQNPMDPWQRPLNYPLIWMHAFRALGIDDGNLVAVGLLFALLYLLVVSWLVLTAATRMEAVVLGLAAVSHAALFAVERGNTDLLIFVLLVVGLRSRTPHSAVIALPMAVLLKLYPVMALVAVCCRRWRDGVLGWLLLGLGCVALLLAQWGDILRLAHATPEDARWSYGLLSLRALLQASGVAPGAAVGYLACTVGVGALLSLARGIVGAGLPPCALVGSVGMRAQSLPIERLFVGCGAVYVGTFLLGSNYDYRLLMLLPTLPWWWRAFVRQGHRLRDLLPVLVVLLAMNVDALGGRGLWLGHVLKVLVLFCLLHDVPRVMRGWLQTEPERALATA